MAESRAGSGTEARPAHIANLGGGAPIFTACGPGSSAVCAAKVSAARCGNASGHFLTRATALSPSIIDYWVRCFRAGARVVKVPRPLARFRLHDGQKSAASDDAANEIRTIVRKTLEAQPPLPPALRRRIAAQLSYDLAPTRAAAGVPTLGQGRPRWTIVSGSALLRHPGWIFSPEVRARLQAAFPAQRRLLSWRKMRFQSQSMISPGRIWWHLRRDVKRGWDATYHDYRTLPQIEQWYWPFWGEVPATVPIHVLTGGKDWLSLAAWMLASFFHFSELAWPVVIHDDGTLPEDAPRHTD